MPFWSAVCSLAGPDDGDEDPGDEEDDEGAAKHAFKKLKKYFCGNDCSDSKSSFTSAGGEVPLGLEGEDGEGEGHAGAV